MNHLQVRSRLLVPLHFPYSKYQDSAVTTLPSTTSAPWYTGFYKCVRHLSLFLPCAVRRVAVNRGTGTQLLTTMNTQARKARAAPLTPLHSTSSVLETADRDSEGPAQVTLREKGNHFMVSFCIFITSLGTDLLPLVGPRGV